MSKIPFFQFLIQRLEISLPGRAAQLKMAPEPVEGQYQHNGQPPEDATPNSVILLLFPGESGEIECLLTHRTEQIRHGGQISFPGGRSEHGEQPHQTALREMQEEVGIPPGFVEVAGRITSLYLHTTSSLILPFVGLMESPPRLKLHPGEVQEAFTVPLNQLADEKNIVREIWQLRGRDYRVPYWDIHSVPLWGATAMMLSEMIEIYREFSG